MPAGSTGAGCRLLVEMGALGDECWVLEVMADAWWERWEHWDPGVGTWSPGGWMRDAGIWNSGGWMRDAGTGNAGGWMREEGTRECWDMEFWGMDARSWSSGCWQLSAGCRALGVGIVAAGSWGQTPFCRIKVVQTSIAPELFLTAWKELWHPGFGMPQRVGGPRGGSAQPDTSGCGGAKIWLEKTQIHGK